MYESGNEDIETINENQNQKIIDDLRLEISTLKQMVENRNQELQKPTSNDSEKIEALSHVLGINRMKEQISELNNGQNAIIQKLSELITAFNTKAQSPEPDIGNPIDKINLITTLLDKGTQLYSTYKQNASPNVAPLIDQDFINKRMVDSFMEDLDTGKSISTFIKNSLKKTATKNIVNTALKDIGTESDDIA